MIRENKNTVFRFEVPDLTDKTLTISLTNHSDERTQAPSNASKEAIKRSVSLQGERLVYSEDLHPEVKQVFERITQPRKPTTKKKTQLSGGFSLTAWKKQYANAKTDEERKELKKTLALKAFNAVYESHHKTP